MKRIAIIGAGGLGATTAALLVKMQESGMLGEGIHITLIDANPHIYGGAIDDANVNHRTGLEYLKPGHQDTGIDCIHGGTTKDLICGDRFPTGIQNRFLVSQGTNHLYQSEQGRSGWELFEANARFMRDDIYAPLYGYIAKERGQKDLPLIAPDKFAYLLFTDTHADLSDIVGGYGSTGGTVVMAYDYALKKAVIDGAVKKGIVTLQLNTAATGIHKTADGKYHVEGADISADMVLVTAAHQMPKLAQNLSGAKPHEGMFHLNGILYAKLPATLNETLREQASRINFVVQGGQGCMFAPVLAPTATEDGLAATYYPSGRGSQVARHKFSAAEARAVPAEWDLRIKEGLPQNRTFGEVAMTRDERIERILQQAYFFNPFLKGYIEPQELRVRTVFNPVTLANPDGSDLRVRQMMEPAILSDDGLVLGMTSPKWTTLELGALGLAGKAIEQLNLANPLPTHETFGLGPQNLDVEQISRTLHFRDVPISRADALEFALRNRQPPRIVDTNPALFIHEALSVKATSGGGLGGTIKQQRGH